MSFSAKAATPSAAQPPPLPAAPTPKPKSSESAPTPKPTVPSLKQSTPKEKVPLPSVRQAGPQEPKEKSLQKQAKQLAMAASSRGGTPSGSQEKQKTGESHRDSIAVQPPMRPTIELQQPEPKAAPSKTNGSSVQTPAKHPKPPKRASTEGDGPRPTKIVKLNTSKISRGELEKLDKRSKPNLPVTVKFGGWDRLRKRKNDIPQAGSIRAATKHRRPDDKSGVGNSSAGPATPATRISEFAPITSSPTAPSSSNATAVSGPSSQHQSSQPGGSSGKPRKPLPEMRKPLPSAAPNNTPTPSKQPPPTSPLAPKGQPTKVKIKLKQPTAGSPS